MNSIKNFITTKPTKKLVNTPIKNANENSNSIIFNIVAANTIGVDSKNVYFATATLSTFKALPIVIVAPDLDTPGIKANTCDIPIKKACLNDIFSYVVSDLDFLSTIYNNIPITIKAVATINGLVKYSSK